MTILLASFPRSGNTLFRIVANAIFGMKSADVYDPDAPERENAAERKLVLITGHSRLAELDNENLAGFLKTHEPADEKDARSAICLLRDGRDAYVSYAHAALAYFQTQVPGIDFHGVLRELVQGGGYFGGWSRNVESWLARKAPSVYVRYEELIADPARYVQDSVHALGLSPDMTGSAVPEFEELHSMMPSFFRKGRAGSWRDEMPADIQELFWQHHGATMERLGYPR